MKTTFSNGHNNCLPVGACDMVFTVLGGLIRRLYVFLIYILINVFTKAKMYSLTLSYKKELYVLNL